MLILMYLLLCAATDMPWYAYCIGVAVWLFSTDWRN